MGKIIKLGFKLIIYALRIIILLFILGSILIYVWFSFASCNDNSDLNPGGRLNTIWVSEHPDIYFIVKKDEDNSCYACLGTFKNSEKSYNVMMDFGFGRDTSVTIMDYDSLEKNDFTFDMNQILARADCKFSENKCIITVTESSIDCIKVGDKITFNKVEELPDWANETDMVY